MFHQPYRLRILFVLCVFGVALVALIGRLYWLQVVRHDFYVKQALRYQVRNVPIRPKRGNIYDRNRRALAISTSLPTLYANTLQLPSDKTDLAIKLGKVLDHPAEKVYDLLNKRGRLPIERTMADEIAEPVRNLLVNDLAWCNAFYLERESKRQYAKGRLACHILGYTTFDQNGETSGLAGLERQYDGEIRGNYKKYQVLRDAQSGLLTPINENYWSSAFGDELVLTLDESIQHVAESVLRTEIAKYQASCGVVVVQRCKTGEILAMASWPDFDPGDFGAAQPKSLCNHAVGYAFGLGSVMKTFTAAILLETGRLTRLDEPINCHNGVGSFPGRPIPVRDVRDHVLGIVPFRDVFRFSSNVGMCEAAQRLDRNAYSRLLESFGFGRRTGIDLPHENPGILRPVSRWTALSMSALPYGAEMSATPVQLVAAVSAVANGGLLMKPYIVKEVRTYEGRLVRRTEPIVRRRVISPITSRQMLELMEDVVGHPTVDGKWEGGTGKEARIAGYRVGGKTGTSPWISHPTSYTASFVAVLPLPDPELTIFCCVDEPHGEKYGSVVAAPIVRKVAEHSLRILGIPPTQTAPSATDVQMTLHRVRDGGQVARQTAPRGTMPDLRGLTMREVSDCLVGLELRLSYEGSGVVAAQEPPPLTPLRGVRECHVVFNRPDASDQPSAVSDQQLAVSLIDGR